MFEHLYDDPYDRPHGPGNPDYEHDSEQQRLLEEERTQQSYGEEHDPQDPESK